MPPIDALQGLQQSLIRKSTNGSVFAAPFSAATINDSTLFDTTTGDLTTLPTGYTDLGYLTDAGAQFGRQQTESNTTSWQSVSPTRSEVTADTTTLHVQAQETKLITIGMYVGVDVSATAVKTTSAPNGVVRINRPRTPASRYWRVLAVSVDETDAGEVVIARYLPKAKVTAFGDQSFDKSDNALLWDVTFTGFVDDVVGTPESFLFGGAGWKALITAMGFTLHA